MRKRPPVEWHMTVSHDEVSFHVNMVPRELKKRWPEARARLLEAVKEVDAYAKRAVRLAKGHRATGAR